MGREQGIEKDNNTMIVPNNSIEANENNNNNNKNVGIIFGNLSTKQFKFAITDSEVRRMGYVQVWHEQNGWVLGQIIELNLESKLSFSKAQQLSRSMNSVESSELGMDNYGLSTPAASNNELQNQNDQGKLVGMVNVIGYRDKHGAVQLPSSPFNAGQPVHPADNDLIKSVLGLDVPQHVGAYIGLLQNHKLKIHLDINSLVQKHVSVIAKTGSGKSYIVGVMVEELIKRKIPLVIIDPHGEYSDLMHPNIDEHDTRIMSKYGVRPHGYSDYIREYSINSDVNLGTLPFKLPSYGLSADTIAELLGLRGTGVQTAILYKAINRIASKKELYTLRDLIHVIELDRNSAKWHLVNSLENLIATGMFSDRPVRLNDLVQVGRASVINLRGLAPTEQQIAVMHLTRQLFEARKLNRIPALMLVIEEAHQFCPQQGQARSLNIIKTIASEGRKFGLGMCVVSQRPALVDKNVLSQCNTQIILKVTNPNDLKALVASVEGLTTAMIDEIQRLPISTAIVIGSGIQLPVFVDVRVRETKHGGRPVDIFSNVDTFWADQDEKKALADRSTQTPNAESMFDLELINPPEHEENDKNYQKPMSVSEQLAKENRPNELPESFLDNLDLGVKLPRNTRSRDDEDGE